MAVVSKASGSIAIASHNVRRLRLRTHNRTQQNITPPMASESASQVSPLRPLIPKAWFSSVTTP